MINQTKVDWTNPLPIIKQEMVDRAVAGIKSQGGPATAPSGACLYRTDDGKACGIGHCLTDAELAEFTVERYSPDSRPTSAAVLIREMVPMGNPTELGHLAEFSLALQRCHDYSAQEAKGYSVGYFMHSFAERVATLCRVEHLRQPSF